MTIQQRVQQLCHDYNAHEPYIDADYRGIEIENEEVYSYDKLPAYLTFTFNKQFRYQPRACKFYNIR